MTDEAEQPGDSPLNHALTLAACGLRVLPIKPGHKRPPMQSWQHAASTDPTVIRKWWNGLYRGHGVGIAMGRQPDGRRLFAVDVDEHDPAASGSDTLAQLEHAHGKLPDTVRSITGSGGAHLIFDSGELEVTNGAAGALGPGIDVRGEGGQIVVAPSIHPDGGVYAWEHGCAPWETTIAPAPAWLLAMVVPPVEQIVAEPVRTRTSTPTDTPADRLRNEWDWRTELYRRGWQLHHADPRTGDTHWTRPGKEHRQGSSGVLHGNDGPFVVFTTDASVEGMWRAGKVGNGCVSLSPIAYVAAYDHGGDVSAAARALRATQVPQAPPEAAQGTQDVPEGIVGVDDELRSMLVDWPTFWDTDRSEAEWLAEPILPAKRSVAMFAPGGTGKSLLALWLAAALATGRPIFGHRNPPRSVLYLDYEMTDADLAERLEAMGYGPDDNLDGLHYALLPSLPGLDEKEGGQAVLRLAELVEAELVVIDTFGRAVHGDENESDTVRDWYRWTGKGLKAAGRAFVRVDHAGKDVEKGQRGTSAKNDDVDVVWRLARQDGDTFRLVAKKRRMGWVPETVDLVLREEDNLEYALLAGASYPAGTREVMDTLDALGVPVEASARAAADTLKAAGKGRRAVLVRAAQKARAAVDNYPPDAPQTASQNPGRTPRGDEWDAPRDAPLDETTNPQVDSSGRGAGRGGTHPGGTGGTQCASLVGTHCVPVLPELPDPDELF